jgi:hypothetical protein
VARVITPERQEYLREYKKRYLANSENRERQRELDREYGKRNRAKRTAAMKQWRTENREWYRYSERAREIARYARRTGSIVATPCEVCGTEKVEAHHDDYAKPLEVRWLCKPHHWQADQGRRSRGT